MIAGLILLSISLKPFFSFPDFGGWIIASGLSYFLLLFYLPRLWLVVLPLVTVCFDLTTYTGRFLFNELDLVFLATIAFAWCSGCFSFFRASRKLPLLLTVSYLFVVLSGFSAWPSFLFPPEAVSGNPYYLPEYGYKVVKGLLWGLFLTPLLLNNFSSDREKTLQWMLAGFCSAAIVLGGVIFWERGIFSVLFSGSHWYQLAGAVFDLASSYRTTGIFSDMHTGGEVIDGVILLLLPATLCGGFYQGKVWLRVIAVVAFGALAYCTVVGFTRATYAAFFFSSVLFFGLFWLHHKRTTSHGERFPSGLLGVVLALAMVAAFVAFKFAGSLGLVCFVGLILSGIPYYWLLSKQLLVARLTLFVGVIFMALAVKAHLQSSWVSSSVFKAVVIVLVFAVAYGMLLLLSSRMVNQSRFNGVILIVFLALFPAVFAIALGGYKFNERMGEVGRDFDKRLVHWEKVVESSGSGVFVGLLGNGVGSFPANYLYQYPEALADVGSFAVEGADGRRYIAIGPGEDLAFGQRIPLVPGTEYKVSMQVKAAGKGKIAVFVCERNLIFANNFHPNCKTTLIRFTDTAGQFRQFSATVNSGKVGLKPSLQRWPTTLYLKNFTKQRVNIDEIVFSAGGENVLKNASFEQGADSWFFFNDYAHLPWHIKNTFLQAWYDTGWLGLLLLLALVALLAKRAVSSSDHAAYLALCCVGVSGIGVFGLFGSPLDSARVSWMFYLFLFSAILLPRDPVSVNRNAAINNEVING
ncbi:MAG: hypothetical protein R3E73_03980 [Porticoccaceae bacterium]